MSTVYTIGSKKNRPNPLESSSAAHVREHRHDVVFSSVEIPDYDPGIAAAFRRLGDEYDDLASQLFDDDPDLTADIQPG